MKKIFELVYGKKLDSIEEIKYSLPLYLIEGKSFYKVAISGKTFVVVFSVNKNRFNVVNLKKQLSSYRQLIKEEIAFGFDTISFFQRRSMIENDIPFVSRNGQMYLPFIGVFFEKCPINEDTAKEEFSPVAQLLFLYLSASYESFHAPNH